MFITVLQQVRAICQARLAYSRALRDFLEKGVHEAIIEWRSCFYQNAEPMTEFDLASAKTLLINDRIIVERHYETIMQKIDTPQTAETELEYLMDELDLQFRGYIFTNTALQHQKTETRTTKNTKKNPEAASISKQLRPNYSEYFYAEEILDRLRPCISPMHRAFIKPHELVLSGFSDTGIPKIRWILKKSGRELSIEKQWFDTFFKKCIDFYRSMQRDPLMLEDIKSIINLNQIIKAWRDHQSLDPELNLWQRYRKTKALSMCCTEAEKNFSECQKLVKASLKKKSSSLASKKEIKTTPLIVLAPLNHPKSLDTSAPTESLSKACSDFQAARIRTTKEKVAAERHPKALEKKQASENHRIQQQKQFMAGSASLEQRLRTAFQRLVLLSQSSVALLGKIFDDTGMHRIRYEEIDDCAPVLSMCDGTSESPSHPRKRRKFFGLGRPASARCANRAIASAMTLRRIVYFFRALLKRALQKILAPTSGLHARRSLIAAASMRARQFLGPRPGQLQGSITSPGRGESHRKICIAPLHPSLEDGTCIGLFDVQTPRPINTQRSDAPAITFMHRPHGPAHDSRLPRFSIRTIRTLLEQIGLTALLLDQFEHAQRQCINTIDYQANTLITVDTLVAIALEASRQSTQICLS